MSSRIQDDSQVAKPNGPVRMARWIEQNFVVPVGRRWIEKALVLPVGQVSIAEARFLGELVGNLADPGPIVEIGTLFGSSTRSMVLYKDPARELITVDAYVWNPLRLSPDRHHNVTTRILADAVRNHNVRMVRADKADFFASYDGPPPALAFLDADHSYEETAKDIAWAKKAGAKVICLHDYGPDFPGVIRAVDEAGGVKQRVETLVVMN